MNRLKIFFAIVLLLAALPFWRFIDMLPWFSSSQTILTSTLFLWSSLFLVLPMSLLYKKILVPGLIINLCFAFLVQFFASPYSSHTLDIPEARHCSVINYSGLFYIVKDFMPAAHEDDLLIRNQICWLKKLSQSIPESINKHETQIYTEVINNKLMLPELKWKTSLPFIIPLYIKLDDGITKSIDGQKFWNEHYTAEVSERDYNFLSFPHSSYIKWEYRLLETIWPEFLDTIEINEEITTN